MVCVMNFCPGVSHYWEAKPIPEFPQGCEGPSVLLASGIASASIHRTREEHTGVWENSKLRGIFGPIGMEEENWNKNRHLGVLRFSFLNNTNTVIKSRRARFTVHVARKGDIRKQKSSAFNCKVQVKFNLSLVLSTYEASKRCTLTHCTGVTMLLCIFEIS